MSGHRVELVLGVLVVAAFISSLAAGEVTLVPGMAMPVGPGLITCPKWIAKTNVPVSPGPTSAPATGVREDDRAEQAGRLLYMPHQNRQTVVSDDRSIDPLRRALACQRLARIGTAAAFERLVHLLDDPDSLVRAHAASAIARFNDPRAESALVRALSAKDWRTRRCAAEGLAAIGGAGALKALATRTDDESPWVRKIARAALADTVARS